MTADKDYIAQLRALWKQAFDDSEETLDAFFSTAFSPDRHASIQQNGKVISALYWFDCTLHDRPIAYIYAVATDLAFRGQHYFRTLLENTHKTLQQKGYAGVVLVPCSSELFALYEKFGYRALCSIDERICTQGAKAVEMHRIDQNQYANLRRQYLPAGSILQEGENLDFLQTQDVFYAGNDFIMAVSNEEPDFLVHEFLGDPAAMGSILHALQIPSGTFRMPGKSKAFAMFLPLQADCPTPTYFGLAFD